MKFKKTYSFAFWCSLIISLFLTALLIVLGYVFDSPIDTMVFLLMITCCFAFSFIIIQIRVERFIYKRIKTIYDDVSLQDVDDLKKAAVSTNMETLSKEVKKFAEKKQIEIANLYQQESYRREFLGNVSHELKTPLFTVQGYLLTLMDGAIDDKEISIKYLDRANKGVDRLVAIVKDLDMISKLESNELGLTIEKFNLIDLLFGTFDLLEMEAKKNGITFSLNKQYDIPILVQADKKGIEQVLLNLLMNSIKYGKSGGTTTVSIEPYGHKKILVKVTDNGEGIKKEHLSRLFERFYRVDQSRSRGQGGSGLGLSIVKHIIEAHDETILVKSTHSEGSEFSFTLKKVK